MTAILPTIGLFASLNLLFPVPLVIGVACIIAGSLRTGVDAQRSATAIWLLLCLGSAVGPFVIRAWGERSGKPIRIVLPIGYRGQFSIVKDSKRGEKPELHNGTWEFRIPENGILQLKKTFPFEMWHHESYVYADGQVANVESLGTVAGNIQTGPNRFEGSSAYDGTEYRFKVLNNAALPDNPSAR